MGPEQASATIRRRTPWEGVDLGIAMARRWFLPLWGLWWMTALPVLLLSVALFPRQPAIAFTVIWWLKPLYEPALLVWMGRRLFAERPTLRQLLRQWRQIWLPRLLPNLLWRRLSSRRSFYMPVSHLEGLTGKPRQRRLEILGRMQSPAGWLTIVGIHVEGILEFGLLLLLLYLIPGDIDPTDLLPLLQNDQSWLMWMGNLCWLLAMSVVAPFYVGGGFGMYLARRTELEAWDIELAFRDMQPRFATTRNLGTALALCLSVATLWPCHPAMAATPDREAVQQAVERVMQSADFGTREQEQVWRYTGDRNDKAQVSAHDMGWVENVAAILRVLAWAAVIIFITWLLWRIAEAFPTLSGRLPRGRRQATSGPRVVMGLTIDPQTLPDDIPAAVNALLDSGDLRGALALLYRATLADLVHRHQLGIRDSSTEGECRRLVQQQRPEAESGFFNQLTDAWLWTAYGHRPPTGDHVRALNDSWRQLYGGPYGQP